MNFVETRVRLLADLMSHRLLWLLIGSYVLAALIPEPGLWLRSVNLAAVTGGGLPRVSVPSVLLSFLLFNAGLGVSTNRLWQLAQRPTLLTVGVLANLLLPVIFILGAATTMQLWHNPREVQEILIGLVIAAGALAHIPAVMLPVIFYNLIQHVVAGCVDHYWLGGGDISPPKQKLRLTGEV